MSISSRKRGFTAIEVMIVLAVLCVLAAIAVPNFVEMQYRAKRAEVPGNVDGIKTALLAYESAYGEVIHEPVPRPDALPGKHSRAWRSGSQFDTLGWLPEGEVRGSYVIEAAGKAFKIKGFCDVDGNGAYAVYTATRSTNAVRTTPGSAY
jgi:type IV pilus assembly protein PilA